MEFADGHSFMTLSFGSVLNVGPSLDSSLLLLPSQKIALMQRLGNMYGLIVPSFLQM